jgi:3',5'-cyclic AMP phosphodiesterase CpdA
MKPASPAITRRHFLQATALAGAFAPASLGAVTSPEEGNEVAILNDTHISGDSDDPAIPAHVCEDHPTNLRAAVQQILSLPRRPAAVIVNGDLAWWIGKPGDYRAFAALIAPLREAGLNVHFTMGNHDNREEFARAFPEIRSTTRFKDHRHNSLIDLQNARLILLDSLKESPAATGRLGDEQIAWLLQKADETPDKPVVLVTHHNPRAGGDPVHFPGGIEDTDLFWPELVKRPQVKGYIHGHVHDWTLAQHSGIHIINTLASSFVANKATGATGRTLARFQPDGIELHIQPFEPSHPWSHETKWLFWRHPRKG